MSKTREVFRKEYKEEKGEEKSKEGKKGGKERGKEGGRKREKGRRGKLYLYSQDFSSHEEFCRPQEYNRL